MKNTGNYLKALLFASLFLLLNSCIHQEQFAISYTMADEITGVYKGKSSFVCNAMTEYDSEVVLIKKDASVVIASLRINGKEVTRAECNLIKENLVGMTIYSFEMNGGMGQVSQESLVLSFPQTGNGCDYVFSGTAQSQGL